MRNNFHHISCRNPRGKTRKEKPSGHILCDLILSRVCFCKILGSDNANELQFPLQYFHGNSAQPPNSILCTKNTVCSCVVQFNYFGMKMRKKKQLSPIQQKKQICSINFWYSGTEIFNLQFQSIYYCQVTISLLLLFGKTALQSREMK